MGIKNKDILENFANDTLNASAVCGKSLDVTNISDAALLVGSPQRRTKAMSEIITGGMKVNRYARDPERLQLQLLELAFKDELTGLHNRRGFHILAKRQFRLAKAKKRGLLMFFADVDGLKQINDQFGHLEGDQALIRTATAIKKTFRKSDVTARLSGDEFIALVLEDSEYNSEHNAETISRRLESNLARYATKETRYRLSLSMGIARFDPQVASSLQALMTQADAELYEKKKNRSNGRASESLHCERVSNVVIEHQIPSDDSLIDAQQLNPVMHVNAVCFSPSFVSNRVVDGVNQ